MREKIKKRLAYLRARQHATLQDPPHMLTLHPVHEIDFDCKPYEMEQHEYKFNIRWDDIGGKNKHYT